MWRLLKNGGQNNNILNMFTGIITDIGTIIEAQNRNGWFHVRIGAPATAARLREGSSVAVNGVCLTANHLSATGEIDFSILPATLRITTISAWQVGGRVNLECALRVGDELGGHFVYGHVDGCGTVASVIAEENSKRLHIIIPPALLPYRAPKGSVCVDGVSLTISALTDDGFEVALVEYTLQHTTLDSLLVGDQVQVEMDMLLKFLHQTPSKIS